jgi:protein disulfide-isomerase-like protein
MKVKVNLAKASGKVIKKAVEKGAPNNKLSIALWVILGIFILAVIIFAVFYPNRFKKNNVNPESFDNYNALMENMSITDSPADSPSDSPDQVMNSTIPTLVLFYADWCGHCQKIKPMYSKLREKYRDNKKHRVAMINSDDHKEFSKKNGITGFPTIRYYTNPKEDKFVEYLGERTEKAMQNFMAR